MAEKKFITTSRQAIHELGGPVFIAELFGFKGPNAVRNWYKRKMPPESYHKLAPRLRAAGCDFNDEDLFQQYPIKASGKGDPAPRKSRGAKP